MSRLKADRMTMQQVLEIEGEIRPVPGYSGVYAARSGNLYCYSKSEPARLYRAFPYLERNRLKVNIPRADGWTIALCCRLVALAFIPGDGKYLQFKNGDFTDCRAENLYWSSVELPGKGSWKLNPGQVETIRARLAAGDKQKDIAKDYGVHPSMITFIKKGKRHENQPA